MQQVPTLGEQGFVAEILVGGGAPDVGGDIVAGGQNFLGAQGGADDAAAAQDVRPVFPAIGAGLEFVEALDNAFRATGRHGRLGIAFVVKAKVVEDFLAFLEHAFHAVADDGRDFVGEGGIIDVKRRHGGGTERLNGRPGVAALRR